MSHAKSSTWSPPEEFAEYRVVRLLGEGAMGKVFLAQDIVLDRPVAVKFLGTGDLGGPARDRFLIEARALARLQHPNVVAVYRVGELGARPYLVSEFVHGQSLDKGIGKSSLCHAGVGPVIASGALGDSRTWQTVAMYPGRRPIPSLVTATASAFGLDNAAFEQALASRDAAAASAIRHAMLRALGSERGVLLILDHLEELVTISAKDEAHAVAEFLAELVAARSSGFRMLGIVRGDYLARTANLPGLGECMSRSLYVLQPMTAEGIELAITGSRP